MDSFNFMAPEHIINYNSLEKQTEELEITDYIIFKLLFMNGKILQIYLDKSITLIELKLWLIKYWQIHDNQTFENDIVFIKDTLIIKTCIELKISDISSDILSVTINRLKLYTDNFICTKCTHWDDFYGRSENYNITCLGCECISEYCGFLMPKFVEKNNSKYYLPKIISPILLNRNPSFTELNWTIIRNRLKKKINKFKNSQYYKIYNSNKYDC